MNEDGGRYEPIPQPSEPLSKREQFVLAIAQRRKFNAADYKYHARAVVDYVDALFEEMRLLEERQAAK